MKQLKLAMVGAALVSSVLFTQSAFAKDKDGLNEDYVGKTGAVQTQIATQSTTQSTDQASEEKSDSAKDSTLANEQIQVPAYGYGNDRKK